MEGVGRRCVGKEGGWRHRRSQAWQRMGREVNSSPLTLRASKRSWPSCPWPGDGSQPYPSLLSAMSTLCSPGVLSSRVIPRDHLPSLVHSGQTALLPGSARTCLLPTSPPKSHFPTPGPHFPHFPASGCTDPVGRSQFSCSNCCGKDLDQITGMGLDLGELGSFLNKP